MARAGREAAEADEDILVLQRAVNTQDGFAVRAWFVERGHPEVGREEVNSLLAVAKLLDFCGFQLRFKKSR